MKFYVTYPGNTSIPWLTDSTVTIEAENAKEAFDKFTSNGYKNIRNCIRVVAAGEWVSDYRHPMTALWEKSIVEVGKLDRCKDNGHWLQWVEKQDHPRHSVDQYNPFAPKEHEETWKYKLAVFCCSCGLIVHKEEGESGIPKQPMVAWHVKEWINYPQGGIHGGGDS